MEHRDRATGWKHAKLSGHKNEDMVKSLLDTNDVFQNRFLCGIDKSNTRIIQTSVGGLHETNVPSVNGKKLNQKPI